MGFLSLKAQNFLFYGKELWSIFDLVAG